MPISQSVLDQNRQPNIFLAEGYEFLCDVLQRFLESDLPERETFLLARLDDGSYRVERVDRINAHLSRQDSEQQSRELYRPLADLTWPKVKRVTDINGQMADKEVTDWKRRLKGEALVVVDGDAFVALVYEPEPMRSSIGKTLRELFSGWIGSTSAAAPEESAALPADEEGFAPSKGLEDMPGDLERELAMAAPDGPLEMALPAQANGESPEPAPALTVPFHTDIRFVNRLKPGETRPLTVQLTKEAAPQSVSEGTVLVGFRAEFTPETIHIHLDAPGFSERTDTWQRAIEVFSFQDSDKATFILSAGQEEGERQISIDFRHKDRLIGNARFVMQVSSQPVSAAPAAADVLTFRQPPPALDISSAPPPPPDVELRIRVNGKRLTFELHSPYQAVL